MGINFPNAPAVNDLYPVSPGPGIPQYQWDGTKWVAAQNSSAGAVAPINNPVFTGDPQAPTPAAGDSDTSIATTAFVTNVAVRYDSAQALTAAQQVQARQNIAAAPLDALAFNGMQVNGSMEISQWLAGNTNNGISGGISNMLDGFKINCGGPVVVMGQVVGDAPPGYSNSLKVSVTTADAALAAGSMATIYHYIEGYRIARLRFGTANAQPLSIGFWVKAHRPGQYGGTVLNSAANRSYPFSYTINAADTWEFKTVTVTGDVTGTWLGGTSLGLLISFALAAGATYAGAAGVWAAANLATATGCVNGIAATTDTFQITGVIVLPGIELPSATRAPFIMRPFDQELALCQRYYEKSYDHFTPPGTVVDAGMAFIMTNYSTAAVYGLVNTVMFKIGKRTTPTMTAYSNGTGASGKVRDRFNSTDVTATFNNIGEKAISWSGVPSASASQINLSMHYVADARF